MDNEIYYKAYMPEHKHYFVIVCMQWFDENGYDQSRFLKKNGQVLQWDSEEEAEKYLVEHIKSDYIEPGIIIRNLNHDTFYKEK